MILKEYLKLMRPRQWFKSFYIAIGAIPAIFLMPVNPILILILLGYGILNMILIQGVMYVINDISDVEKDKLHPVKKFRPIASGKIKKHHALIFAIFLSVLSIGSAIIIDYRIAAIDIILILNNILYSIKPFRFKDIIYLDILTAALNFPLRVIVGWFLFEPYNQARLSINFNLIMTKFGEETIQSILFKAMPAIIDFNIKFSTITLSFISMFLFTYFFACFLLSLKRLAEKLSENSEKLRKVLYYYTTAKLKVVSILSAILTVFFATLLAISIKPILIILTPYLLYSIKWYYNQTFKPNSFVKQPELIFTKEKKFILLSIIFLLICIFLLII